MTGKLAVEEKIDLGRYDERFYSIVGRGDENVKFFSKLFGVKIVPRGTELIVKGDADKVGKFLSFMRSALKRVEREGLTSSEIRKYAGDFLEHKDGGEELDEQGEVILVTHRRRAIVPKTDTQRRYVEAIKNNDVVFGVGPAGTGKTYLAMAVALSHLKDQRVNKIILTRPAVEAGEKLGFLPGSIAEKVDPYLRPLYDALYDMVDYDKVMYMLERNIIEIAPLAFMRGRTLNDSFIILDEAQNATKEQMKMFLTRIGFGSKVVITGDITQIDLPKKEHSGLVEALRVLDGVEGIGFVWFSQEDVVRHPIVARIIEAYESHEQDRDNPQEGADQEGMVREEGDQSP